MRSQQFLLFLLCVVVVAVAFGGCWSAKENSVVVYTALDSEFSEPILQKFTAETGIKTLPKFDVESTKTVGLANALIAEKARPRADVFWNNEIVNTLRLRDEGVLDTYISPVGEQYPEAFRGTDGRWYGFAARARVLIVNTRLVPEDQRPTSIHDLADPKWRGKIGIAKPLFGTTATHATCLFAAWGDKKAKEYFRAEGQRCADSCRQQAGGTLRRLGTVGLRPDRHGRRHYREGEGRAGGDRLSRPGTRSARHVIYS